jgi:hypothetical protein
MFDQQWDIFPPFAEWRHCNGIYINAVKKIGPEASGSYFSVKIPVRG